MNFYIFKDYYERNLEYLEYSAFKLSEKTSVIKYRRWLFECLNQYGKIIPIERDIKPERLSNLLNKPNAIFIVYFPRYYSEYSRIPMRILNLSLGALLLDTKCIYGAKCFPSAQVELVSTRFQVKRLQSIFHNLLPKLYVFPPKVDIDFFIPPSRKQRLLARKRQQIEEWQIHLLYVSRLVVTKGLCQLIRVLDIWPIPNIVLTVVGDIDAGHRLAYSSGNHFTFAHFLANEVLQKKRSWLRLQTSVKSKEELRELFWSADLFVNPSIQPDENFGITPREAASCGLPVVTTNFGGLYPLAESMPWKGLDTYPALFGSRFSLRQFHRLLISAIKQHRYFSPEDYRETILGECDPTIAKKNLKMAIEWLKNRPPERPLNSIPHMRRAEKRLFSTLDRKISKLFLNQKQLSSSGSYVYGDSPPSFLYKYITSPNFPIIQGIFSAQKNPPLVEKNTKWCGFFRISFWEQERSVIELGFPGPRIKRYSKKLWTSLCKCTFFEEPGEYVIVPKNKTQISQVQELVNLGYLVFDT